MTKPIIPESIRHFLRRTLSNPQTQIQEMGYLHDKLTAEQFTTFLIEFCAGIVYVYLEYGTVPKSLELQDGDDSLKNFAYDVESQKVILYRSAIDYFCTTDTDKILNQYRLSESNTLLVTKTEWVIMCGIEEAYHHYQFTKQDGKYLPIQFSANLSGDEYINNLVEADAHRYAGEAIRAFGFCGEFKVEINKSTTLYSTFEWCKIDLDVMKQDLYNCPVQKWHLLSALKQQGKRKKI